LPESNVGAAIRLPDKTQPPLDFDFERVAGHATVPPGLGRQAVGLVGHPARVSTTEVAEHMQAAEDRLCEVTVPVHTAEADDVANAITSHP
jgi:hypothetical protein